MSKYIAKGSQKGRKPSKNKKGKKLKIALIVSMCLLLITAGSGFLMLYNLLDKISNVDERTQPDEIELEPEENPENYPKGEDPDIDDIYKIPIREGSTKDMENILLIGRDARPGEINGRSDSMVILTIDKKEKTIKMTSILRDLYVTFPDDEYLPARINHAHSWGGPIYLLDTITQNLRIRISKYISVDFGGLENVIDTIGGVDINLTDAEAERIGVSAGMNHLNGAQALSFTRIRYIDSDFRRTGRQRQVLEEIFNKGKKKNPVEIVSLANELLPLVTTNMSKMEIVGFASNSNKYMKYPMAGEMMIPQEGTYEGQMIRDMALLVADMPTNVKDLHIHIFGNFIGPPAE